MKNPFDSYSLIARAYPALISAMPLFILWYSLSKFDELNNLLEFILSIEFVGELTIAVVFLYFYAQLIRAISLVVEKRLFTSKRGFPSAYFLLYSDDHYSTSYKDEFRRRASLVFNLSLPTQDDESDRPDDAQRQLCELSKHMILYVKKGELIFKHNIWYGFFRNLIGGSIFSILFCILNIFVGVFILESVILWSTSTVMLIIFTTLFVFKDAILIQQAEAYGKQLISEFMEKANSNETTK